jgi:Ca2+-binding EF-hand superfamily protein
MSAFGWVRVNPSFSPPTKQRAPAPSRTNTLVKSPSIGHMVSTSGSTGTATTIGLAIRTPPPLVMQHSTDPSSSSSNRFSTPPFEQVRPTLSGRQSGKSAAERARHAASVARASAAGVSSFHEVVSDEALQAFHALDTNGTGMLDLDEVRQELRKLEAVGLSEGLLDAIDWDADRTKITSTEWADHFNGLARVHGRSVTSGYLRRLVAIKVLRDASADGVRESSRRSPVSPPHDANGSAAVAGASAARAAQAASDVAKGAPSGEPVLEEQVREALALNFTSLVDLFNTWDADGNGAISRLEFGKAVAALRIEASTEEIDKTFRSFDADGSGTISSFELQRYLAAKNIQLAVDDVLRSEANFDDERRGEGEA